MQINVLLHAPNNTDDHVHTQSLLQDCAFHVVNVETRFVNFLMKSI
jgi:hypothetical protein